MKYLKLFESFTEDDLINFKKLQLEQNLRICKDKNFDISNGKFISLYHGTNPANFKKILKSNKLKSGTWLAIDYETARRYGNMATKRGEPVVTLCVVNLEDLYYNGYWSTARDVYFGNGVYSS